MKSLIGAVRRIFPKKKNEPGSVSVRGPIEKEDGKLVLSIPLAVGGEELVRYTKGIGRVDGYFLKIEIMPWMAEKLEVSEGTIMSVDNLTGEFRIQRYVEEEPNQALQPTAPSGRG